MIIYEDLGNGLIKAYSDQGMMIHGGYPEGDYAEAIEMFGSRECTGGARYDPSND